MKREFAYELENFELDKRVVNLICDMGFIVQEQPDNSFIHRLVKHMPSHLIIVKFEIRRRIIDPPDPTESPEMFNQLQANSFGDYLKKFNMVPPHMMGGEYDEDSVIQEEMEARRYKLKPFVDHDDDQTLFEISIVNRSNQCMTYSCFSHNGEIIINKVQVTPENGIEQAKEQTLNRLSSRLQGRTEQTSKSTKKSTSYPGPQFKNLSEPIQNVLVSYLYEVGVRPELALVCEYLSWHKEQRIYMGWLRQMQQYCTNE